MNMMIESTLRSEDNEEEKDDRASSSSNEDRLGPISNRRRVVRKNLSNFSSQQLGKMNRRIIDRLNFQNNLNSIEFGDE